MSSLENVINNLQSAGIFEFFLPFILIFAVVFGLMQKVGIFGDKKESEVRKLNALIAFVFAAFIMIYPTTNDLVFNLTDYIANFVGGTFIFILGIISFMIMAFMISNASGEKNDDKSKFKLGSTSIGIALVLVIALFLTSGGVLSLGGLQFNSNFNLNFGNIDPNVIALIGVLVAVGVGIWYLTK